VSGDALALQFFCSIVTRGLRGLNGLFVLWRRSMTVAFIRPALMERRYRSRNAIGEIHRVSQRFFPVDTARESHERGEWTMFRKILLLICVYLRN